MKISLRMHQGDVDTASRAAQDRIMEHEIIACRKGDFGAEKRMLNSFMPLLLSLARKRSRDPATVNRCIEAGKAGLQKAIRKYKTSIGPEKFRIFAVKYIEESIDRDLAGGKQGLWARLFG